MPPFSKDDYYKLLQTITILEMKVQRLEVNLEVNGQYGNETTLPMTQISGQEQANSQLISTTKKQEAGVLDSKSTSSPPWYSLGAKPKHKTCRDKSLPSDMGKRLTGRIQHSKTVDEAEWPALPLHGSVSSTPVPRRKQPWTVATTKSKSKPPQDTGILLENRYVPLLQDLDSPKASSSSSTRERYETKSCNKRVQKELTTAPQTLIVGDGAVNEMKRFCNMKNTKVLCFSNDMVSDITEKILRITAEHPTVTSLIVHTGALDVVKPKSEVLKQDFVDLLDKVKSLYPKVFISGPLPTVRGGDERFSRLMMLNRWLKDTCAAHSVNFIDNFNIFWERRHLFKADGFCLNKSGVRLLSSNIFYFVRQTPAAPAKDKKQDVPKQQIRRRSGDDLLSPGLRTNPERQQTQKEVTSSSPQHEESSPPPKAQHEEFPPAPTTPRPPRTPPSPSLSMDSPLLDFTDRMNDLVTIGTQLTPRQKPLFPSLKPPYRAAPPSPPRRKESSSKTHRAPPPPLKHVFCESD